MTFSGFAEPKENWSKLPHEFIAALSFVETESELKVILYILRHTWGYGDDEKGITIEEFCKGRKRKDQSRIDAGTGQSENSVRDGIKRAIEHGFVVIARVDESDKARIKTYYALSSKSEVRGANIEVGASKSEVRGATSDPQGSKVEAHPSIVEARSEKETSERNPERNISTGAGAKKENDSLNAVEVWDQVKVELSRKLNKQQYKQCIQGTHGISFDGSVLTIHPYSALNQEILQNGIGTIIQGVVNGIFNRPIQIHYEVSP